MAGVTYDEGQSNLRSIIIFSSYLLLCSSLTFLILRDLYTQAFSPSRSSATTAAHAKPARQVSKRSSPGLQLFSALSAVSIAITWYYMFSFFSLSYRVWAHEHGVPLPQDLPAAIYSFISPSSSSSPTASLSVTAGGGGGGGGGYYDNLRLGSWLRDVQLFRDAWEVALETSPRLFWSQPIFFVTAAWSMFLGIETHRRRIPHSWAYMVLGQIVAISFAMNLFFLAVLLFPVSFTSTTTSTGTSSSSSNVVKRSTWTPQRLLYGLCVLVTFASVACIPYVTGTSSFLRVLLVPHVVLVVPSFLHAAIPARWGVEHGSVPAADRYLRGVFELALVLGLYCQFMVGFDALTNPHKDSHLHRHSALYPGSDSAGSDASYNRLGSIDRALYDHPAVSSVGWDSLLCTLSFLCWRATRSVSAAES